MRIILCPLLPTLVWKLPVRTRPSVPLATADLHLKKITAPAGTVIARLTGAEGTGPKSARFVGQCLELIDTSRSGMLACPTHAFVQSAAYGGKPGLMIHFWTANFLRKDNIPSYQWQYRK